VNPFDRFNSKVQKADDCWLWIGAKKPTGYGNFYMRGKYETAHRASWLLFRGEIALGLYVMHKCDTPSCVNPSHLSLGTPKENQEDMYRKGRDRHGRITDEQCAAIIALRSSGKKLREIADIYRCSQANVSLIARGLSHVRTVRQAA